MGLSRARWANEDTGFWSRERTLALALFLLTALAVAVCFLVVRPFLSALAWAAALAVAAFPVYRWLEKKIRRKDLAATVAVLLVAGLVVTPAVLVIQTIAREAAAGIESVRPMFTPEGWRALSQKNPPLARLLQQIERHVDLRQTAERAAAAISGGTMAFVRGSVRSIIDLLIVFFALFYFFRDSRKCVSTIYSMLPLSREEAKHVLTRLRDTIYATVFGTIAIAAIQGTLGGLMFWWLGLQSPVLWGVVMGLLAIVPVLGAFVIWIPAAIILALQGLWLKAILLTIWGAIVIGLVDNLLYPMLVGKKMQLHTLPVFFAIVGGLILFGSAGIIIGPVVLSLTVALMDVWRRRTADGETIEESLAVEEPAKTT